jgi:hypothetical protein
MQFAQILCCKQIQNIRNVDRYQPTLDCPRDGKIFKHSTLEAHDGCDRSAQDAYFSMTPDPTLAFVGGRCCPAHDFVFAFWIMITFNILLTSLSDIAATKRFKQVYIAATTGKRF